ncbi:structural maintenance of chromosomes protein 6-like [Dendronephthya gigantea]|uniref:structural maintenance of chromosomes protein 6-like n=1 Tax=Dendronephthya gigantea TaxID=151771 RepID=UPI00106B1107|nr:structural maintenance of chromosomes protein 6-like [Dendronephthya gigantea]
MATKRSCSNGGKRSSKRQRTEENGVQNDSDMSDEDNGTISANHVNNCSQNPGFSIQEPTNEADVGIIEEIILQNFMCHSHLRVPLSPSVNFIIGRNGSGKSAIMTAIVVGLGGKASNTNRGNSLKGFVKDKCSTAVIRIKLKNCGQDAFKPQEYGEHIIVERRISSDGVGSYKLSNANGNIVSTKKAELSHILDQFNIQIDNPVSILNQDTSRNFLYASDPGKKYKFFCKATQLEQMNNDYLTIQEHQRIMSITLEKKQETLPEMENEVNKLQEKYRDLEQLKVLEGKIDDLKKEIAWAQVYEKEKKLKPIVANINSEKERLPRYDERLQECETNIAQMEANWGEVKTEMDTISSESDQLTVRQESINKEVKKMRDIVKIHQNELKKMERELNNTERERNELQQRIKDITSNAMKDIESERLERERSLQEKRENLQSIQFQLNTTNNHKNQVEQNVARSTNDLYQLRNDTNDAKKNVEQAQRKLSSLRDGQKNSLKRFGSNVPELLQRIETAVRRGRFNKTPKGPIGARIKLRAERWAVPVETCLKSLAFAFCCNDTNDANVLRDLMKGIYERNRTPQVIVSKFQDEYYDISMNKPHCNYPTVLDVLQIDDPVVFNCIVDQTAAECVLLIEDPVEARDVMFNNTPRNARMAFAGNGDQIFGGRSAKSYAYTGSGSSYLKGNIDDQIRRVQAQLEEETGRYDQLKADHNVQEKALRELQVELKKNKIKSMKEQDVYNKILQEITELEQFEEEPVPDVTVLQDDVNTLTQQIDGIIAENDNKTKEFLQARKSYEEKSNESDAHKAKIQDVIGKAEPLTLRLNVIEAELATAKGHRKHYHDKKAELLKKISNMEAELLGLTEDAENAARMAAQYCTRIQTRRTVKSLESEISQTERRLRAEQQTRGQIEEITKQYTEAKERLNNVNISMKSLKVLCKNLGKMLEERVQVYATYRKLIALRANMHFQMMLSQRGYTGRMKLKHKEEELHLLVDVDQTSKDGTKSTKSLSGGERSFSTVSFIMALWDAMEAPFRCLDEFDVFMDMVNRRISMESIMKVAKEQRHRQFILLTPQDMSNVGQNERTKIFRLQDPERGQTTLPFQPVNS